MKFAKECIAFFNENKIMQASAALSYYLTMTFFPLLIIVYSFLGNSYERTKQLIDFCGKLLSEDIVAFISDFLLYVDSGDRGLMLPIGLSLLLAYASAALRSVQSTIGAIQGGAEHRGLCSYLFSFVYSLTLLALAYFALVLMLSGAMIATRLGELLPGISRITSLLPLHYLLLALLLFLFLLGIYHVPKRRQDKYRVLPGAALTSLALMLSGPVFSFVMSRSVKYSLVYGSLASLILLMLWLYLCCVLIYCGAIFNVALYETKKYGNK